MKAFIFVCLLAGSSLNLEPTAMAAHFSPGQQKSNTLSVPRPTCPAGTIRENGVCDPPDPTGPPVYCGNNIWATFGHCPAGTTLPPCRGGHRTSNGTMTECQ